MENVMTNKKVILFVDNSVTGDKLEKTFYRYNFDVIRVGDKNEIISMIVKEEPNAIVIDWDLANGTVAKIQNFLGDNFRKTAFVLLSKNKNAEERIRALDDGADDCFEQPPEIEELAAKIRALVRRIDLVENTPKSLHIKDIEINLDTHEVFLDGTLLDLTYTQFKILYLLASHREYVFTRNEILQKVWGDNVYVTDRTVDVHVKRLREKLGEQKNISKYIQTIHGLGYRFA